jgi:hypothetical protein
MSPVLRRMAQHPQVNLRVGYCSLRGAEATYDPEFTSTVKWDVPLLEGYEWTEIPNQGSGSESFFGLCNFGVWDLIRHGQFDAIIFSSEQTPTVLLPVIHIHGNSLLRGFSGPACIP